MADQELARQLTSLQARMNRVETILQQLLAILASSGATSTGEQIQLQRLVQQLHGDQELPLEEQPEMAAIRAALLAGNKIQAIKLYRSVYGVGLKEAKDAIDAL